MRATHLLPLLLPAAQATKVLLPLYVYPSWQGWWDNVYAAIAAHPGVPFQVILNPDNGPGGGGGGGGGPQPGFNSDWAAGVARLNAHPNVQTFGYVYTGYGARPAADVDADVDAWAAWNDDGASAAGPGDISVRGVFFDEVPNWSGRRGGDDVGFMAGRAAHARARFNATTTTTTTTTMDFQTIYNVGARVAHPEYFAAAGDGGADYVVVYENYAAAYDPSVVLRDNVPASAALAARSSVLLHDFVAAGLPASDVAAWLGDLVGAGLGSANVLDYGYDRANTADGPADIGSVAEMLSS